MPLIGRAIVKAAGEISEDKDAAAKLRREVIFPTLEKGGILKLSKPSAAGQALRSTERYGSASRRVLTSMRVPIEWTDGPGTPSGTLTLKCVTVNCTK